MGGKEFAVGQIPKEFVGTAHLTAPGSHLQFLDSNKNQGSNLHLQHHLMTKIEECAELQTKYERLQTDHEDLLHLLHQIAEAAPNVIDKILLAGPGGAAESGTAGAATAGAATAGAATAGAAT